jgi:hypothetical protein
MIRPLGGGFCLTEMQDEKQHRRQIAEAANAALRGESHNTGRFTAPPGEKFSLENPRLGVGRVLLLTPRNGAAASARWYVDEEKSGAMTIVFNPPLTETAEFSFAVVGVGQ